MEQTKGNCYDHEKLIPIICSSMTDYHNWSSIDSSQIKIQNSNGLGASRTFHVTAPKQCEYNEIGLHFPQSATLISTMIAALKVMQQAELSPKLLAVGTNYFIDQWKCAKKPSKNPNYWKDCGVLLAKIHMIPTNWWEPLKAQYIEEDPAVAKFPQGSLAWGYIKREVWQKCLPKMDQATKIELASAITTDHPVGKRIVTSHGDFHPGNIIDLGQEEKERCQVIDYEFSCVTHAIQDLAFGIACCGQDAKKKKMFLQAYLKKLGYPAEEKDIRSLQLQAEICQLASWHSGGMLAPWDLQNKEQEEILELIAVIKKFVDFIRKSKIGQQKILKTKLCVYLDSNKNSIYELKKNKFLKITEVFKKETSDFHSFLKSEKCQIDPTVDQILKKAVWSQPPKAKLPIKIGKSNELGFDSSFTAMCWVKNQKPYTDHWHNGRNPIFIGDVNPEKSKKQWGDFKSKIFHLELRHQNRYYFGFGWDDASSERVCVDGKWEHVAFVYREDGEKKEKIIIVNGKKQKNRHGTESKKYEGDEVIWLGTGKSHGTGKWAGKIEGAMIYKEALNQEEVLKIAIATNPQRVTL